MPRAWIQCVFCPEETVVNVPEPPAPGVDYRSANTPCQHCGRRIKVKTYPDGSWEPKEPCLFVSEACMEASLPEGSRVVVSLLRLQDSYIRQVPGGKQLLRQYYYDAQRLYDTIEGNMDIREFLKEIYFTFVSPAYRYAVAGEDEQAARCLKNMFQHIKQTAAAIENQHPQPK